MALWYNEKKIIYFFNFSARNTSFTKARIKKKITNLLTSFNIFQLLNNKFINSSKLTIIISF